MHILLLYLHVQSTELEKKLPPINSCYADTLDGIASTQQAGSIITYISKNSRDITTYKADFS